MTLLDGRLFVNLASYDNQYRMFAPFNTLSFFACTNFYLYAYSKQSAILPPIKYDKL